MSRDLSSSTTIQGTGDDEETEHDEEEGGNGNANYRLLSFGSLEEDFAWLDELCYFLSPS